MFLNLSKNLLEASIIEAAKRVDTEYRSHLSYAVPASVKSPQLH